MRVISDGRDWEKRRPDCQIPLYAFWPAGRRWTVEAVDQYEGKIVPGKDPMERQHYCCTVIPLETPPPRRGPRLTGARASWETGRLELERRRLIGVTGATT